MDIPSNFDQAVEAARMQIGPDQIVIIISGPQALMAVQKVSEILVEAMKRPAYRGGGQRGEFHGLFMLPPDLSTFNSGDSLQVPIASYSWDKKYERIKFYSPFDKNGQLTSKVGMQVNSLKPATKKGAEIVKGWEYDQSGNAKGIKLRLLRLMVGVDKDDASKKYLFVVSIDQAPGSDPESLTYTTPPQSPASNNGGDGRGADVTQTGELNENIPS